MFISYSCVSKSSKNIIAKYDSGVVYISEAIAEFKKLSKEEQKEFKDIEEYFRLVRKIALEKIILNNALIEGYFELDETKKKIKEIKAEEALNVFHDNYIRKKVKVKKSDYAEYENCYELYQIVKRTDIDKKEKIDINRELLMKISNDIDDLESFKKKAGEYSDDITASEGGFVGEIRLGIMEEEIDNTIKKMKANEISDIVESSVGLHIFYVNNIKKISYKELCDDQSLIEQIYNRKKALFEEQWYNELLNDKKLTIYEKVIINGNDENDIIVRYKDIIIKRKEFNTTVENLRKGIFPEPNIEELKRLAQNIALRIVLEEKALHNRLDKKRDFKSKIDERTRTLIISEYINRNIEVKDISKNDIRDYYNNNIDTLFTFILDDGSQYIQPINELEDFITKKLTRENSRESRYMLYRKLVNNENLEIFDDKLKILKSRTTK